MITIGGKEITAAYVGNVPCRLSMPGKTGMVCDKQLFRTWILERRRAVERIGRWNGSSKLINE